MYPHMLCTAPWVLHLRSCCSCLSVIKAVVPSSLVSLSERLWYFHLWSLHHKGCGTFISGLSISGTYISCLSVWMAVVPSSLVSPSVVPSSLVFPSKRLWYLNLLSLSERLWYLRLWSLHLWYLHLWSLHLWYFHLLSLLLNGCGTFIEGARWRTPVFSSGTFLC